MLIKEFVFGENISIVYVLVRNLVGRDNGTYHGKNKQNANDKCRCYGRLIFRKAVEGVFQIGNGLCLQFFIMQLFSGRMENKFFT